MKDINQNTLKDAFGKLPTHSPPDSEWSEINQKLNYKSLQKALDSLPVYAAPDFTLVEEIRVSEQKLTKIFEIPNWSKFALRTAATVLLFGSVYYFIADDSPINSPDLHEEIAEVYEIPESSTDEEFSEIMQLCEADAWVCEKPGFNDLKSDYQELENAQLELVNAMQTYGEDLNLIKQFNDIERRKALVLNDLSLFI
jgi:hypothetical protein